VLKLKPDYVMF